MNRILAPAIGLLNRFSYPHKFLLMGIIVFMPLALSLYLLNTELNVRIEAVQKERIGVEYARALRMLLQHMQQDRGMTAAYLAGDASFGPRIAVKHGQRDDAIKSIDALNMRHGDILEVTERWNSLKKQIQDLQARERVADITVEQSFTDHSAAIDDLLSLFLYVGNVSGLKLDPQLDSSSLQSAITRQLPQLSEALGRIRAKTSASLAKSRITEEERINIYMHYGLARSLAKESINTYKTGFEFNPNLKEKLENPVSTIRIHTDEFLATNNNHIESSQTNGDAAGYFQVATRFIDDIYRTYDVTLLALDKLLVARALELSQKRQIAWAIAGIGLITIGWLSLGFSLSIVQSIGGLRSSVKRILNDDFSAHLDSSSHDELGELTRDFNKMSVRLEDHIAALNQKTVELKKRNSLIESNQHAIRQISMSTADLLSAITLKDFADKSLAILGRILRSPADCLFCLNDYGIQQNLVIAGIGRFADIPSTPTADFGETLVRQRIAPSLEAAAPSAEDHWTVWKIPTSGLGSISIYLECAQSDSLTIDWEVEALFCNEVTTTYGQLTHMENVKRAHRAAIIALADLAEFKDSETGGHVMRVAHLTDEITWVLREKNCFPGDITEEFVEQVGTASILHDVGKVAIPDQILLKRGKLNAEERKRMETHTVRGGAILARAGRVAQETLYLSLAAEIAESHHEQYDGSGYPKGLQGEAIPLAARIVAVVDVFDALTSKRPYKEPWPIQQTIDYIREKAGSQFDPVIVEAFLTALDRRSRTRRIVWTSELSVGNSDLDNDHMKLINLINQVATAQTLENQSYVAYVLEELFAYFQDHFRREEAHMEAIGYSELEAHKFEHERFANRLNLIRWQYQRGFREHINESLLKETPNKPSRSEGLKVG